MSLVLWLVGTTCPQFPSGSDAVLCQSVLADQAGARQLWPAGGQGDFWMQTRSGGKIKNQDPVLGPVVEETRHWELLTVLKST